MKNKKIIFIIAIIILLLLVGFLIYNKVVNDESRYFKEITFKELTKKLDNMEDVTICLTQTTCSHCASYKPKLSKVANKYEVVVYYMEVDQLSEAEKDKLNNYFTYKGTPTTIFIKEGKEETVASRITGDASYDNIVKKFKTNGIIK